MEKDFGVEVLKPKRAKRALHKWLGRVGASTGTVVQWSDTSFPKLKGTKAEDWLAASKTNVRMHLGVIYHRLLASTRVNIEIEVYDRDEEDAGPPEVVTAIDPFGFAASALGDYPKDLIARVGDSRLKMECYVVPPKSSGPQYRLYGHDGADFQGFYIYRNDRLLQIGGWQHVATTSRNRSLARVKIDDFDALRSHVKMSPKKDSIRFSPTSLQRSPRPARQVQRTRRSRSINTCTARKAFSLSRSGGITLESRSCNRVRGSMRM